MSDLGPAVAITVMYAALFGSAELMRHFLRVGSNATRSYVHIASAILALGIPLAAGWPATVALGLVFTLVLAVSRWRLVLPAIHDVERSTLGEVLFPLGIACTALLVPIWNAYAYGVLVLGLGDGSAGIVGRCYGKPRLLLGTPKSLAGSAACFGVSFTLAVGFSHSTTVTNWAYCGIAALVVTAAEAALGWGLDNLVLPVLGAALYVRLIGP
jgi:dolichol kinase